MSNWLLWSVFVVGVVIGELLMAIFQPEITAPGIMALVLCLSVALFMFHQESKEQR